MLDADRALPPERRIWARFLHVLTGTPPHEWNEGVCQAYRAIVKEYNQAAQTL